MNADLQKASLSKRIAALLLDFILLTILITGAATVLTAVTDYDTYVAVADGRQKHFESEYNVRFDISEEEYLALSEEKQQIYTDAYQAMYKDKEFLGAYNMMLSLIMVIFSLSILIGVNDCGHALRCGIQSVTKKYDKYYRLLLDETYEQLPDAFTFVLDDGTRGNLVQEVRLVDGKCCFNWRPVRPIPEDDDFFENVWRAFRETGNFD